jgi:hypothetical protein
VDGLHVKGVTKDEWNTLLSAQIGEPIPGEDALHSHCDIFSVRGDGLEKEVRVSGHVSVQNDLAVLVQDAQVHGPGVQIDSTVVSVLLGVESHLRSPP